MPNNAIGWHLVLGWVYGHSWFVDPVRKLMTVVALTNTGLEGMNGQFPTDPWKAVYAALTATQGTG